MTTDLSGPLPLCVTIGEPAGIGPDIILTAFAQHRDGALPAFFVLGDPDLLARRARQLGLEVAIDLQMPGKPLSPDRLTVIALSRPMVGVPGAPVLQDAALVIEAISSAVDMVFSNQSSGVVTCPISKEALYGAGFSHPGHTEFLAALAQDHTGKVHRPVMMIASDLLRTVPVTIHIPLKDVPASLTTGLVIETARIVATDLIGKFGIENPRLAVSGLNPHAGEGGAMGREDMEIIAPAIAALRAEGIDAFGPLPADTMFHAKARAGYDAALCMYHDQALIPAKTLAFDDGVNVTLGLPFIRTSPDHGTAFSIAGTGKADASSFIAALKMAHRFSLKQAQ